MFRSILSIAVLFSVLGTPSEAAPPFKWKRSHTLAGFLEIGKGVHPHKCRQFGFDKFYSLGSGGAEILDVVTVAPAQVLCAATAARYIPSGRRAWPKRNGEKLQLNREGTPDEKLTISKTATGFLFEVSAAGSTYELRQQRTEAAYQWLSLPKLTVAVAKQHPDAVADYQKLRSIAEGAIVCSAKKQTCSLELLDGASVDLPDSIEAIKVLDRDFGWKTSDTFTRSVRLVWGGLQKATLYILEE